jgi:hypothetical protein
MFRRVADVSTDHTAIFSADLNFDGTQFVVVGQTDNSNMHHFVLVDAKNRKVAMKAVFFSKLCCHAQLLNPAF